MSKVATFIDITSLYYKLLKKFGSGKLDYAKYLKEVEKLTGQKSDSVIAYGCQENNEAAPFIKYLRSLNIFTKYKGPYVLKIGSRPIKRCNWLVGISMDVVKAVENGATTIVLGVSNPDIYPLVQYLVDKNIKVIVLSCNIPKYVSKICEPHEIAEELIDVNQAD
ncbi:MAG: NYN domain-containing protein [Clostridia bacterium]|jgi:uncharacterized LabA/DUF88 family protein